jgi:hypothetical protein
MMQSDFFFAQPRALYGWARLLSLFRSFSEYNESPSGEEADARALFCDWVVVGQDLHAAWSLCDAEERAKLEEQQGKLFSAL